MGLCFSEKNINLEEFKGKPLGAYLPDGSLAKLQSIEIEFHKPDFSDIADYAAHRATSVNISFVDRSGSVKTFKASGAYFWRFLESVPEPFRILSEDNTTESYINESLETVMHIARYVYRSCFVDTTFENTSIPPLSCTLDFETFTYSVKKANRLPESESKIISSLVNDKINKLDVSEFATGFVDGMLKDGYLIRSYKADGDLMIPDFKPASWDTEKHSVLSDYLSELSHHTHDDCPAYMIWSSVLDSKVKSLIRNLFSELFTIETLKQRDDLPMAYAIVGARDELFAIQGANESVDVLSNRVFIAIDSYLTAMGKRH